MSEAMDLGRKGEDLAAAFLKAEGYHIRERNWRFGKDELDIIAENDRHLVFVEVKTRRKGALLPPGAAVNQSKRTFMVRAAEAYINRYDLDVNARFDILCIEIDGDRHSIEHIDEAFYPTLRFRQ